jgi:hypothetical protein
MLQHKITQLNLSLMKTSAMEYQLKSNMTISPLI